MYLNNSVYKQKLIIRAFYESISRKTKKKSAQNKYYDDWSRDEDQDYVRIRTRLLKL